MQLSDQRLIDIGPKQLSLAAVWPRPSTSTEGPLEDAVLAAAQRELPVAEIWRAARSGAEPLRRRLESLGLVLDFGQRFVAQALPLLLALVVPAAGAYKIYVGLERGRPVAFLVIACLAAAGLAAALFGRRPLRSRRGDATLALLRSEHASSTTADQNEPSAGAPDLVDAVALLGLGAVAGTALAPLQNYLGGTSGQRRFWNSQSDSSSCGSSCGSGGDGGGGSGGDGGGGCGGGGCGGCGGGGD